MSENAQLEQIVRRLNILIALQLDVANSDDRRPVTKILRLSEMGLSTSEIATILGKTQNYITATLSNQKRKKGK